MPGLLALIQQEALNDLAEARHRYILSGLHTNDNQLPNQGRQTPDYLMSYKIILEDDCEAC